jgi:hypothetical protein
MRFLKLAAISLLAVFMLFTFIGLLMPSSVTVGRSQDIHASIDSVRFYTNDLNNWKYWINGADTANFKQLSSGTTIINSKVKLGIYTITIIKNDAKYITTVWQGENSKAQVSNIKLYYNSNENATVVSWSFMQQLSWYPWERLGAMLHDKILGPSMEASLLKLKQVVENK